ncbi:MAG: hypothetical protein ACOYME_04990 [Prochlorotrichaceae cyanobacterium]|jgi:hypothetical protein
MESRESRGTDATPYCTDKETQGATESGDPVAIVLYGFFMV